MRHSLTSDVRLALIRRLPLATALVALAVFLTAEAPRAAGDADPPGQHVTLIGDSVASALEWVPAGDIVRQGTDIDLQLAPCRRIEETSCDYGNSRPPTVIDLVNSMGASLGPTVVVVVGYNDYEDVFGRDVEDALDAMKAAGVKRVLWLTLHEAHHPYIAMNDDLMAVAARRPELTVLDWNQFSRSHPDWFQDDGLHLLGAGAFAFATFIRSALVTLGLVVTPTTTTTTTTTAPATGSKPASAERTSRVEVVTAKVPDARRGKPFKTLLRATGGSPPYRWRRVAALPKGILLATDGLVAGIPRSPGTYFLSVRVTDALGRKATQRVMLRVSA